MVERWSLSELGGNIHSVWGIDSAPALQLEGKMRAVRACSPLWLGRPACQAKVLVLVPLGTTPMAPFLSVSILGGQML